MPTNNALTPELIAETIQAVREIAAEDGPDSYQGVVLRYVEQLRRQLAEARNYSTRVEGWMERAADQIDCGIRVGGDEWFTKANIEKVLHDVAPDLEAIRREVRREVWLEAIKICEEDGAIYTAGRMAEEGRSDHA